MSALLSEQDLNDFISPGLACVKPIKPTTSKDENEPSGEIEVGKESNELEKVSISLQDCLACVGCITSSEEILLSRQSHTVFLDAWKQLQEAKERDLVVSISPQSRISLAGYYNMGVTEFDAVFATIFEKYFNAKHVVGTQIGRIVTINRTNNHLMGMKKNGKAGPKLCTVCPGFVLYVEKTKPELLPFLLNVKSPQQITGSLLKDGARQNGRKFYHLTIMPCFDKKLEASRADGEDEVDCVITPKEFVTMLDELQIDIDQYKNIPDDSTLFARLSPNKWDHKTHWATNEGSSSGGYAYQYILAQSLQLHRQGGKGKILTLQGKNSDVLEYRLVDEEGTTVASSSELYGFRNIQNMVRRLTGGKNRNNNNLLKKRNITVLRKRNQTNVLEADPYKSEFIEVMACPGGCINGGGLINSTRVKDSNKDSTKKRGLVQLRNSIYIQEIPTTNVLTDEWVHDVLSDPHSYEYTFTAVTDTNQSDDDPSPDIATLGNTW